MKIVWPSHLDLSDHLILLRRLDPLRKWESLDDQRFCRCCHKFISGRQIEVIKGAPQPKNCARCARQIIVPPLPKTGFIPTKSRNRPTRGDAVLFGLSIRTEKDLSSAEKRAPIPDDVYPGDPCLARPRPRDARAPNIQIVGGPKFAHLSLSGLR